MDIIEKLQKEINIVRPSTAQVSQIFGQNKATFYKELGMKGHNGIDYMNRIGNAIIAPCNIEITCAQTDNGYGTTLWAISKKSFFEEDREYKLEFVFGHLSKFIETKGDINMGMTIARTGNTGKYTTGAHLHFGLRPIYRIQGKSNWTVFNKNNGYFGYLDPKGFEAKTYKDIPIIIFKDWKSNAVYQLGVSGEYMAHSDPQLFQRLYGKFSNLNIERLKSELPYTPERMTIASLQKFLRIFNK